MRVVGAPGGPLAGLTFAAKDLFDVAGHPTGGGNPDWARTHPVPTRHAWAVQRLLDSGRHAHRQDRHRRAFARHPRRESLRRHAAQPDGARASAWRVLVGLGLRGRSGALRHRARHRHGRVGARAGQLLRTLRDPADPRPSRSHRDAAAGAELGHDRVVRARRRTFARVSAALLGEPIPDRACRRPGSSSPWTPSASPMPRPPPPCNRWCAGSRRWWVTFARISSRRPGCPSGRERSSTLQRHEAWLTFRDWIDRDNPRLAYSVARNLASASRITRVRAAVGRADARRGARPSLVAASAGDDPVHADDAVSGAGQGDAARGARSAARAHRLSDRPRRAHRRATGESAGRDRRWAPVGLSIVGARGSDAVLVAVAQAMEGNR